MKNDSDKEEDKSTSDELTKTPLVNLSYAYELWNELTKRLRSSSNNSTNISISIRREITKTLLDIYASPKGKLVAALIWDLKAFTTKELMDLTKYSDRVIDYTRNNLIRIGLVRETNIELKKPAGKKGPKPHVYAIGIADENDSVEAKLRYDEIIKQEEMKSKSDREEELRKTAEERRLKSEEKAHLKGTLIQALVTEFEGYYKKTEKPVSLQEIDKKAKIIGLSDYNAYMEVALELEGKGIITWSYLNGNPDPSWKPPSQIRKAREAREEEL